MKSLDTTSDLRKDSTNDDIRGPADISGEPARCRAQCYTTEMKRRRKSLPSKEIRGRKR